MTPPSSFESTSDRHPLPPSEYPSPLHPDYHPGSEGMSRVQGLNVSVLPHPTLQALAALAAEGALRDVPNYDAGLRQFHLFCDICEVDKTKRLPAYFELLRSFAFWAAAPPELVPAQLADKKKLFGTIPVETVREYLGAVEAWHLVHGWPHPLSKDQKQLINWSLKGVASRTRGGGVGGSSGGVYN